MSELQTYVASVRMLSRAAFIEQYKHPFLLAKLEDVAPSAPEDDWGGATRMTRVVGKTGSFAVLRHNAAIYRVYRLVAQNAGAIVAEFSETRSEPKFTVTVGRAPDNDVVIEDNAVSKRHAVFSCDFREHWFLQDLESRNGTSVNGKRLTPRTPVAVNFGDPIVLGSLAVMIIGAGALYEIVSAQLKTG